MFGNGIRGSWLAREAIALGLVNVGNYADEFKVLLKWILELMHLVWLHKDAESLRYFNSFAILANHNTLSSLDFHQVFRVMSVFWRMPSRRNCEIPHYDVLRAVIGTNEDFFSDTFIALGCNFHLVHFVILLDFHNFPPHVVDKF